MDDGKATYVYYEKEGKRVKHGKFSYTWIDNEGGVILEKRFKAILKKTISGTYKDGLKDGKWTYNIQYVDYPLDHTYPQVSYDETFSTGNIVATTSYKDGYPHGNWSFVENYKVRYAEPVGYYSWKWGKFTPSRTKTIKATFNDGVMTGPFNYSHPSEKESAKFTFDNEGFIVGTGTFELNGSKAKLILNSDRIKVKEEQIDSYGDKRVRMDYTSKLADPEFEYMLDTNNIGGLLNKVMGTFEQTRYFNYASILDRSNGLIDGDYFFGYSIKGGNYLEAKECTGFYDKGYLKEAERKLQNNQFDDALYWLQKAKSLLKADRFVCKATREENNNAYESMTKEVKIEKEKARKKKEENQRLNKYYLSENTIDSILKIDRRIINRIVSNNESGFNDLKNYLDDAQYNLGEFYELIKYPFKENETPFIEEYKAKKEREAPYVNKVFYPFQYNWFKIEGAKRKFTQSTMNWLSTLTISEIKFVLPYLIIQSPLENFKQLYNNKVDLATIDPGKLIENLNEIKRYQSPYFMSKSEMFTQMFSEHRDNFNHKNSLMVGVSKHKELNTLLNELLTKIENMKWSDEEIEKLYKLNNIFKNIKEMEKKAIKKEVAKPLSKLATIDEKIEFIISYNK